MCSIAPTIMCTIMMATLHWENNKCSMFSWLLRKECGCHVKYLTLANVLSVNACNVFIGLKVILVKWLATTSVCTS